MTKSIENQLAYNGGEWSPLMDSRVDHPKYRQACRQLHNMVALKQGGATRRPGTKYVGTAKYASSFTVQNNEVRLMKFQYSPTTSFILEFGNHYIRFYSNRQQVTINSAATWVSGSNYVLGNYVTDPSNSLIYYCIASVSGGTTQPHSDSTHWTQQTIYEVPSPYSGVGNISGGSWASEIWQVVPCQVNDVVYLVHPSYPPYKLTRIADTNWTMTQVAFMTPALLDQNATDTTITASATKGSVTLTATAPAWATAKYYTIGNSIDNGPNIYVCIVAHTSGTFANDLAAGYWQYQTVFQSGHVGSVWQLASLVPSNFVQYDITATGTSSSLSALGKWELHTYGVWSADIKLQRSLDNGLTWETVRLISGRSDRNADVTGTAVSRGLYRIDVSNYAAPTNPGATTPRVVFETVDAFFYGHVQITAVSNPYIATATVIDELYNTSATQYWSEAAWSTLRGYPRAITTFQQRMIYGGSGYEPQRIWGTVTNDLENFALGDQTQATDSFAFDLAAVQRGPIEWLIAQTELFVGFSGAEWVVTSGSTSQGANSGAAITPTAINAVEHSSWGSAVGVQPAVVGNAVLYTQRAERTIQQMMFSIYTTKYMSADMTSLSEHMFGAGIAQIDYQPQFRNQGIVWTITKSNGLCGMTYQLEQEIFAWHRHTTGDGTDVGFESVAVVQGTGADDDEVWVVSNRTLGTTKYRYIEYLNPTVWETQGTASQGIPTPTIANAFYVDSGKTITSPGSSTISGFLHLASRYVVGLINGNMTFGPLLVNGSGQITIPNYTPTAGDILQIGLPANYAVQTMRLDLDPRGGVVQGLTKALSKLYLRVVNSLGGSVGDGGAKAVPVNYRTVLTPLNQGPAIFTGEKAIAPFTGAFSTDPVYVIQGSDALPLTLLSVAVKYDVSGSP